MLNLRVVTRVYSSLLTTWFLTTFLVKTRAQYNKLVHHLRVRQFNFLFLIYNIYCHKIWRSSDQNKFLLIHLIVSTIIKSAKFILDTKSRSRESATDILWLYVWMRGRKRTVYTTSKWSIANNFTQYIKNLQSMTLMLRRASSNNQSYKHHNTPKET